MFVTRISRFIYSVRYYPRFHVTAVGLGTYYPWLWGQNLILIFIDLEPRISKPGWLQDFFFYHIAIHPIKSSIISEFL
jgi:hypothetical protein